MRLQYIKEAAVDELLNGIFERMAGAMKRKVLAEQPARNKAGSKA